MMVRGPTEEDNAELTVVFVHGLFSSAQAWCHFDRLMSEDPDLQAVSVLHFEYTSPKFSLNPLRRIPNFNVLADNLQTFLDLETPERSKIVLVTHSQGGLVVQRYLARMLSSARGGELERIRGVIMFACPNSGSEIFSTIRRGLSIWRHPQERELRPIDESVGTALETVISRIVHAKSNSADECPIPIYVYAGETDNIVTSTSAKGVFPNAGVLPGDHFTIIRPDSAKHRSFRAVRAVLLSALSTSPMGDNASTTDPSNAPPRETATVGEQSDLGAITAADQPSSRAKLPVSHVSPEADVSYVIARWNPKHRTVDFILSPEVALSWIDKLGEEEELND